MRDRGPLDELKVLELVGLEDCSCFCGPRKSADLAFRRMDELKANSHSQIEKVNRSEKGNLLPRQTFSPPRSKATPAAWGI